MKTYKALVKHKETKRITYIESDYPTLTSFKKDLRDNGYSIINNQACTKEKYDYILEYTDSNPYYFKLRLNTIKQIVEDGLELSDVILLKLK